MDKNLRSKLHQIMDWRAALTAALIGGTVFFLLNLILSQAVLGSPWVYVQLIASPVFGEEILAPPASFQLNIFLAALLVHFSLAILYTIVIDFTIYRWGLLVGFIGGGLLGLAFYAINFFAIAYLFPWFYLYRGWIMIVGHVAFGALAGGIYELLEVEEFVVEEHRSESHA